MSVSYIPEPYERPYYQALFQAADVQRKGSIGGGEAVQFFARSKLPIEVLKNIWTVADQPSTTSLDLKKFAVAVRLIQLTQNGQKGQGKDLAVPEGVTLRPVFFEGVSGASVPLPQPPSQQQQPPQQQRTQTPPTPSGQRPPIQQPAQLSAPPTPVRQSMAMPPPQTPGGMAMPPPQTPGGTSMALVAQDPYSMTPQDRGRYESLFPQYAKQDGFVYGAEAVALFLKSGVDQTVLREIWSIVDRPVDNRLDKLEFAIAMHLIVCISKKNLPPPKGALPASLLSLKAPPTPSVPPRPPVQPDGRIPSPPPHQVAGGGGGGMPSPRGTFQQTPQYQQPVVQVSGMPMQPTGSFDGGMSQNVPPVVATGGMSISDAFEGLSTTSGDVQHSSSLPAYVPQQGSPKPSTMAHPTTVPEEPLPPQQQAMPPAPTPVAAATVAPPSTKALANSYNMGDSNEELVKLKDALQKLQAENISLKAQMGTMSEEEKDVQKELSATVAEIGKLSNELHALRSDVLAAKTRLLEASAELKAAKDQKSVLTDLIGEAKETKDAIDDAHATVQNAIEAAHQHDQRVDHAVRKSDVFESNLFGSYDAPVPASGLPVQQPEVLVPATSYDLMEASGLAGTSVASGDHFSAHSSPPPPQSLEIPPVETVSSDEAEEPAGGVLPDANDPPLFENEGFSNEYAPPVQAQPPVQQNEYGPPVQAQPPVQQNEYAPPVQAQPPVRQNEYAPPVQAQPPVQQQYQLPPPEPQQFHQPPAPQPTPIIERPAMLSGHYKRESYGFNSDFVMGGSAQTLPEENDDSAMSPAARARSDGSAYGYDDEESYKRVEEMKKRAEAAAETARDAEAAHRKLANESDELRTDADKAEATARSLRAAAEEKKKGRFGGGKKKNMLREAEKAVQDAADIKKRFLTVQGQANDAQGVAMETRREAEKLKEEAEKAELDMASAASLREEQRKQEQEAQTQVQAPPAPSANGGYPGYSQPPAPQAGYGYGQPPPAAPSQGYGYGQYPPAQPQPYQYNSMPAAPSAPNVDPGFSQGVMGGGGSAGGYGLPSPNQMARAQEDTDTNPFAF